MKPSETPAPAGCRKRWRGDRASPENPGEIGGNHWQAGEVEGFEYPGDTRLFNLFCIKLKCVRCIFLFLGKLPMGLGILSTLYVLLYII